MKLVTTTRGGKYQRYLLRGDSEGFVTLWTVPDITIDDIKKMRIDQGEPSKGKCVHRSHTKIYTNHLFAYIHFISTGAHHLHEPQRSLGTDEPFPGRHFRPTVEQRRRTVDQADRQHLSATTKPTSCGTRRRLNHHCAGHANGHDAAVALEQPQLWR